MIGLILNLVYPALCQICGKKTGLWDKNLCEDCLNKIKKRVPPFCIKCGKQLSGEPDLKDFCYDCKSRAFYFDRAISVFYYDGVIMQLIHNFKYKKLTGLAKEFVKFTVDFMEEYAIGGKTDLVLSIPMHPVRLFKREINTSHILAKDIAKKLGAAYSAKLLKKTRYTPPQTMLKRRQRMKNIEGSFSLHKNTSSHVRYKNILLVDDLFTTGSTLNECAKILKEAGSARIEAITLARGDRLS